MKFHVLDWRSYRLPRVARSTLACESQAASEAADAHLFAATFLKAMVTADYSFNDSDPYAWLHSSTLVVDAKALFDVLHRDELQTSAGADKRTHLEALVIKDKLVESKAHARWVSSERQYADGLTKCAAAQLLADRLRSHQFCLINDEDYQAARKKTISERRASAYQFAKARPSTPRTTFWMCCAVHCIPATAATNEIVIRHHGQSFGSVHTDLVAGMLTFLLMLATFFIFYVRPAPWTMLWTTSSRTFFIFYVRPAPWTMLWTTSSRTSRTTATQTESWTLNGPTSSRSVQCLLPRFEDNEAQTYVAYRDSATQLDYLDLNYHAPAVQHNVGTQASLAQPQHEAPRPPSPTDSSGISLREAKKINATLGREVRSLRARVAGRLSLSRWKCLAPLGNMCSTEVQH